MKVARFQMSMSLLERYMDLPRDIEIVAVYPIAPGSGNPRTFWIRVEGERLRELIEGEIIPEVTPIIHKTEDRWEFEYND